MKDCKQRVRMYPKLLLVLIIDVPVEKPVDVGMNPLFVNVVYVGHIIF